MFLHPASHLLSYMFIIRESIRSYIYIVYIYIEFYNYDMQQQLTMYLINIGDQQKPFMWVWGV
jgi:hypothetical protein